MTIDYSEKTFEDAIETSLISEGGYIKGDPNNFDRELALDKKILFEFIQTSQPKEWGKLSNIHKDKVEEKFLYRLNQELSNRDMLDVLRHGITDYGVKFKFAYFKPSSNLNPDSITMYKKNIITVTRQVHYSLKSENSLDMVISINGLPVITIELKNPLTSQTVENAINQYKYDRSSKELLFQFKKRALVHFAVDPDEVYMTTKLTGKDTYFLPFNKGFNNGKGNPPCTEGNYKTSYLWEEVLTKDSLMDIIQKFLHLQKEEKTTSTGKTIIKETMIFPRYHQLNVVRTLIEDAKTNGPGKNYLIQHSAGSGKSNSIAWLAHRLASLHNEIDEAIYDSVIVITDRKVLDQQLQDTIYQFEHKEGVVKKIDKNSTQLAEALQNGVRIIISTLQKFPYVLEKIESLPSKSYAVIVDEAHSSQTGDAATKLKRVLSSANLEEAVKAQMEEEGKVEDSEEEILKTMLSRPQQENLSFFGFTATPKQKTLEVLGIKDESGKARPYHLYSMRQAIEEGFIIDVLKNYTTYNMFFKLSKEITDDPMVNKKKAAIAIARFVSLHPHNLAQKTEVIIEHFHKITMKKIGGLAKAMVVTSSRAHALRYKLEFDEYIKKKKYHEIRALVAFSGVVKHEGTDYTEPDINRTKKGEKISYTELPKKFASDEFQILLVADKYQTGFDQPLLHTMYVDKKLSGVKAVQTLSRLNRTHPGKNSTFILDFYNTTEDIEAAFQPYYEATILGETTDPNKLYDLKGKIGNYQICWPSEIDQFAKIFFKQKKDQSSKDQAKLNALIDPAVERYKTRSEEDQENFKHLVISYVRIYAFLTQVIPFFDVDLEKLFAYSKFLIKKLPKISQDDKYIVGDDVALKYYRLEKTGTHNIGLKNQEGILAGMNDAGNPNNDKDKSTELSKVIDALNKKFDTDFTDADELFFDQIVEDCIEDETLTEQAKKNTIENFEFGFDKVFFDKLFARMNQNESMFRRINDNEEFQSLVMNMIMNKVYKEAQLR